MENFEQIKALGFDGFVTVKELQVNSSIIPKKRGVYMILHDSLQPPIFLDKGVGGFFKGKDPNVQIEILYAKWLNKSIILYIGKAGGGNSKRTLRDRLYEYMRFGMGKNVGHAGGRYIWQLSDCANLIVCWKALESLEPREVEYDLIKKFEGIYGLRPFANLVG